MIEQLLESAGPIAVVVAIGFWKPRLGSAWFRKAESGLARVAQRCVFCVGLVGLIAFALCASISLIAGMPEPCGNDEFSYLLAADTFAHGRLANPTHPLWIHFESLQIIVQPTYASKYPPGQGLALAAGQVITGYPITGVWLSTALACAAIYWMLVAWLPPRWALLGGLLAVLHPTMLWWSQIYMGGAVAVAGGALLAGALRRLETKPSTRDALWMGFAMVVLANTRPYEGMVLSVLCAVVLLGRMARRDRPPVGWMFQRVALPLAAVLGTGALWIGYYNFRVTGSPLRMPYRVHDAAYATAPVFIWQKPIPFPTYHHASIRDFHLGLELSDYHLQRTGRGLASATAKKLKALLDGYFPLFLLGIPLYGLTLLLPILPSVLRSHWMRLALLLVAGFTAGQLLVNWTNVHYAAPAWGLLLLLVVQTLRQLRLWRPFGLPCGLFFSRMVPLLCAASLVPTILQLSNLATEKPWHRERAGLLADLKRAGGRHLIMVRYGPHHPPEYEWVYNDADIDNAPVVWAREMDAAQNSKLLEYFRDRDVWVLEADVQPRRLSPWTPPQSNAGKQSSEPSLRAIPSREYK